MRRGVKRKVSYYAVAWLDDSDADAVSFHVTSKIESANFKFSVRVDKNGPSYDIESLRGNIAAMETLEVLAEHAATHLFRKQIKKNIRAAVT